MSRRRKKRGDGQMGRIKEKKINQMGKRKSD